MKLGISITTWNVLNEAYENKDYYHQNAHAHLQWSNGRREKASTYLLPLKSDIYCLQEVSFSMATDIYKNMNEDYELLWQPRTSKEKKTQDGCAFIYNKRLFSLDQLFVYRYESGNHIFIAGLFTTTTFEKSFWVVNTHINWSSRNEDLLDLQKQLENHPKFTTNVKIIVGDFNAESNESWYKLEDYHLVDAFKKQLGPYSYHSGKSSKWIDFMLLHHLPETAVIGRVVGNNPGVQYIFNDIALPSTNVPSDHLPLTILISI